jgi:transglutaminase-like putative cysteine protease
MILEVQHETSLDYSEPIAEWLTELRMQPISDESQTCHSFHIKVNQPANVFGYVDGFGNRVHHFNLIAPRQKVSVLAASIVETTPATATLAQSQATFPLNIDSAGCEIYDFLGFRGPIRRTPLLGPVLETLTPDREEKVGAWVARVSRWIQATVEYARDVTDSSSPIDDVLAKRKGVCQDLAHLMIAVLRSYRVPARYVSGYIHRPNKDSQSHAWCEAWLPDTKWIGVDPTNGCEVQERFVRVAVGRDFSDVPPNKGTHRGRGQESIFVRVGTRELVRLPSLSWHEQLPPLDVPIQSVARSKPRLDSDEQIQQQQQQQQQTAART